MSNESAPECLTHRDNRNVQTRLDYMLLYRSEVKAKIIRVLETWTNHKYAEWYKSTADSQEHDQEPPEEDLWVTMSYDQLTIFVYGTAQHDTIKQYVDELVASGDIQRRPHPDIPYGSPQYLLNRKRLQHALDALEIPPNLFDLSPLFLSPRKKQTPQEKYPPGRGKEPPRVGVFLPPGTGENTPPSKNPTKNHLERTKKKERVASPHVDAHTRALSEHKNDFHSYRHEHTRKEDAWNCENWCRAHDGTCADYQAAIDTGWHEAETGKQPAIYNPTTQGVPNGQLTDTSTAIASTPGRAESSPPVRDPHSLQGELDGVATALEDSEPRASHGDITQESILADWEAVQGRPQAWTDRHRKAAREGVAARPTQDELRGCRDWLPKTDNPKKPWYRLRGVELWDVIEKLGAYRSYLALSIEPAPLADMKQPKPIDVYTAASLDPERTERNLEKLRAKRLAREAAQQGGTV